MAPWIEKQREECLQLGGGLKGKAMYVFFYGGGICFLCCLLVLSVFGLYRITVSEEAHVVVQEPLNDTLDPPETETLAETETLDKAEEAGFRGTLARDFIFSGIVLMAAVVPCVIACVVEAFARGRTKGKSSDQAAVAAVSAEIARIKAAEEKLKREQMEWYDLPGTEMSPMISNEEASV